MFKYIEVLDSEVPIEKRAAATRMLAYCLDQLRLPNLGIRWFDNAEARYKYRRVLSEFTTGDPILGLVRAKDIKYMLILASAGINNLVFTVAHEVSHLYHWYCTHLDWLEHFKGEPGEVSADNFAEKVVQAGRWRHDDESYYKYLTGVDLSQGRFKARG